MDEAELNEIQQDLRKEWVKIGAKIKLIGASLEHNFSSKNDFTAEHVNSRAISLLRNGGKLDQEYMRLLTRTLLFMSDVERYHRGDL